MINAKKLLADLTRQLKRLEDDLRQRIFEHDELPELKAQLNAEWQAARDANRCAETFPSWAEQLLTQAGVHWLLSGVFLRFIEDNALVDRPWVAGPPESGRLALAQDRFETYFRAHPLENDRDYLVAAFREAGTLPGLQTFFDEAHNPVFRLPISGDAAMALRQFWQQLDPDTGSLVHDFTDPSWNTRFLGDLYQDLSEATRKRYALLQTPEFVEEFILDRTLTPAIGEFGFREVRLIDPTCGSGHFLLGGFQRLVAEWLHAEPGLNPRVIAQHALNAVAGVDLNPFAVAIARFRLWVAALKVAEVRRMADAPNFQVHVAIGDSLLHGSRFGLSETGSLLDASETLAGYGLNHAYVSEDLPQVQQILGRQYHAVVGNPPYIVVKDAALNAAYRLKYDSCHMKYSLGAPFTERFFELAVTGAGNGQRAGYVGLITANSFMKREFGSRLIKQVLPRLDLTHVVDTSGAYIPGHGTPTVILFGCHRAPVKSVVRTVMGIKGEPSTPDDPALGLVWSAIVSQIDRPGSESEFVSATDTPRVTLGKHPWSVGGGGAADLKELLEDGKPKLNSLSESIGFASFPGADEVFSAPASALRRAGYPAETIRRFVVGDAVRDYQIGDENFAFVPYHADLTPIPLDTKSRWASAMWPFRVSLEGVVSFGGKTRKECGDKWWTWYRWVPAKYKAPLSITFAFVATHNHFVLDRGGRVFKQSAPVIKLPSGSGIDDHLGLLGLLNSSVACFWLKQVGHNKGSTVDQHGARQRTAPFEDFYEFTSTKVSDFPLSAACPLRLAKSLDELAQAVASHAPAALVTKPEPPTRKDLDENERMVSTLRGRQLAEQEELDWNCYGLYGLLPEGAAADLESSAPPQLVLGERAFEIVLARRIAAGQEQSTWFERHGSTPIAEIPAHWPEPYRQVVQRRIDLIESDRNIGLIERPEYKRRWNNPAWRTLEKAALRDWLLNKLEAPALWPASADQPPKLTSTRRLADAVAQDTAFMQVAELYAGQTGFDVQQLVAELVASESLPFLPAQRYSETGLRKRAQWESTWALQRQEDAIDARVVADNADAWRAELTVQAKEQFGSADLTDAQAWIAQQLAAEIARQQAEDKAEKIGPIPVPAKYQSKDFLKAEYWRLRGGLDVPKELWVSYPGCERGADGSTPLAWAGWNHLQQATALASYLLEMKDNEGWEPERLQPLLAGLDELVPWLKQWHNDPDAAFDGERMGDYYEGFVADQARELGFTLADLRNWKPTAVARRRGGRPRKVAA